MPLETKKISKDNINLLLGLKQILVKNKEQHYKKSRLITRRNALTRTREISSSIRNYVRNQLINRISNETDNEIV